MIIQKMSDGSYRKKPVGDANINEDKYFILNAYKSRKKLGWDMKRILFDLSHMFPYSSKQIAQLISKEIKI